MLTRIIIGRVARRHGLRVSLSPAAFTDGVGSGAHQHFSLATSEGPLFSGGAGVRGMTPAGESAVAGLLRGLPEAQGILCGSIVSGLRTRPGNWAGAYACWGTENREAAVRFVTAGPGNPYGGNVEVKVIDASANPYFATAAILGLALEGIRQQAELPAETTVDPAARSDQERNRAGIVRLTESQAEAIAALDNSQRLRAILGDPAVDVLVAVRRFEYEHYGDLGRNNLPRSSAWPGAYERADGYGPVAAHRRRSADRSACPRLLVDGRDRQRFENALNEANTEPITYSGFDSQLGFAVRAYCAPLLGLPRHVDAHTYWERRREFAEAEVARVFLRGANVTDWLVDTGFAEGVAGVDEFAAACGGRVHEVVRLEQVAEQAAQAPGDYAAAFEEILHRRAATAAGTKSILAYRGGFDGDLTEPPAAHVAEAAERWRDSGGVRLRDRVLLRFGLHQALRLGKPLQFHVGFGDRDCDLHKTNPLYLLDFLRKSGIPRSCCCTAIPTNAKPAIWRRHLTTSMSTVD
ncbi:glutamine synthetase, catalytic domain protein [Mycobacterium xenopi 3993]|nr:glutamine synthetase, catalytic domain protein [Mycobacterium xenopi 3993]